MTPATTAELPLPDTIPSVLRDSAARFSSRIAIVDREVGDAVGTTLTFAELLAAAQKAARGFMALGIERGDRVAIWAPNCWEWVVAALGLQSAGAVLVPINTRYKGNEAALILGKSGARALVTVAGFLGHDYVAALREARASGALPGLRSIVVARGEAPDDALSWSDFLAGAAGVSDEEAEGRARAVSADDISDLLYTSGTTGSPKGVMSTHAQTLRTFRTWSEIVGLGEGDRYLIVNPYFHSFGYKAGWLACLLTGATNHPQPIFDVARAMERIERDRITVLPGPPTLFLGLLHHPELLRRDLSSLRLAVTGAATIPVELILRMRKELTFKTIITAYGLTESCGVVTMCRHSDDPLTIATTSGRAIPDTEVRVTGSDGEALPAGQPGEVRVRGYNVMKGYFDDPAETAAAVDEDGWLHTGDVGVMDERGYLRITDRTKDMFIVGGFNAYPAEIENTLLRHPSVAQAAVVGVADERLGEVGMAFVVLRSGHGDTALSRKSLSDEILAFGRREMANYKAPRYLEIVAELPLNATGKVLKYQLRERAKQYVSAIQGG